MSAMITKSKVEGPFITCLQIRMSRSSVLPSNDVLLRMALWSCVVVFMLLVKNG